MRIKVAIVGAQGYGGRELARLILRHPQLELAAVFTTATDWALSLDLPECVGKNIAHFASQDLPNHSDGIDVFFLATPANISMQLAQKLMPQTKVIIDLSGAFRLSKNAFESWYGHEHHASEYINHALYGLSPWSMMPPQGKQTLLIANPGCFASCALMALLPLLKSDIIDGNGIIIDAKSGATGAGRALRTSLQFCELSDNFYPYKLGSHQHTPEIEQCLMQQCDITEALNLHLTTQVLPMKRGISMAIYCPLKQGEITPSQTIDLIGVSYQHYYADYPLVRYASVYDASGQQSAMTTALLSLKSVVGSPRVHIVFHADKIRCYLFVCIDNLMKGAASAAIENINHYLKLPVDTGLNEWEGTL